MLLTCLLRAARLLINARARAGGHGGDCRECRRACAEGRCERGAPPPALRAALRLGGGIHCVMMSARAVKVREMG
jgi:hypothetical protein